MNKSRSFYAFKKANKGKIYASTLEKPSEKIQIAKRLDETTMDSNTGYILQYIVGSKLLSVCVLTIILYETSP